MADVSEIPNTSSGETHSKNKENDNLEESSTHTQLLSKDTEGEIDSVEVEKGNGLLRLPIARIKKIMKADPSLGIASQDSVFLVAKATVSFYFYFSLLSKYGKFDFKMKTSHVMIHKSLFFLFYIYVVSLTTCKLLRFCGNYIFF